MGVIKSSDLRDAEDFDVIGEVERKAETVKQNALEKENNKETEGEPNDKRSTEEVLANVGKNIGNALRGFAGGVKNFDDLELLINYGNDKIDVTIGSALDLFGGDMEFAKVLEYCDTTITNLN